jgi:hypothetical protein
MCNDVGGTSRGCAFYSVTGFIFTVSQSAECDDPGERQQTDSFAPFTCFLLRARDRVETASGDGCVAFVDLCVHVVLTICLALSLVLPPLARTHPHTALGRSDATDPTLFHWRY